MGLGQRWCMPAVKYDVWWQQFNDFSVNQLNKVRANTAELIPGHVMLTTKSSQIINHFGGTPPRMLSTPLPAKLCQKSYLL